MNDGGVVLLYGVMQGGQTFVGSVVQHCGWKKRLNMVKP